MVPRQRDLRSSSVAGRRTFGKKTELEERKIGRGRRVHTQNTVGGDLADHESIKRCASDRLGDLVP